MQRREEEERWQVQRQQKGSVRQTRAAEDKTKAPRFSHVGRVRVTKISERKSPLVYRSKATTGWNMYFEGKGTSLRRGSPGRGRERRARTSAKFAWVCAFSSCASASSMAISRTSCATRDGAKSRGVTHTRRRRKNNPRVVRVRLCDKKPGLGRGG